MPSGSRNLPATQVAQRVRPSTVGGGVDRDSIVAGSSGGGSGASRSKSRYCSDSCTPPSPSVIVWCIFWTSAALPPRSPSTTTNCHSGRVRSNGSATISVARSSSWRIDARLGQGDVADVVVDVEVGVVDPQRRREVDRRRLDPLPQPGDVPRRPAPSGARRRSKSGGRSRIVTVPNVDERYGSFSRRHIRPSASLIFRSRQRRPPSDPRTTPPAAGGATVARRGAQRGIDVCLNSLRSATRPGRARARSCATAPVAVTAGQLEQADEHGRGRRR